ncbi:MAG: hypothetical protein Hyperionvirus13_52 [Hyperionvirus sp.]|uniref:Uncharacterized protein n=1 Tax=Hyperionvirus sp. TaxID=2487770 RepID=A0A3G5AEW6_9VIRU|nr:MAG: hypothetical protein Hyperionvirus13_52 [Hyperionvirus sp.]
MTTGLLDFEKPFRIEEWLYYAIDYGQHITLLTRNAINCLQMNIKKK